MELPRLPTPNRQPPVASVVTTAFVVSFLIGGISGALFGNLSANGRLGSWFADTVRSVASSVTNVPLTTNTSSGTTLKVTEDSATTEVVKKMSPAVLSIVAKQDLSKVRQPNFGSPFDDFFPFSTQPQPPQTGKQVVRRASGFVIDSSGLAVTNKHVVDDPSLEYSALTNDGRTYDVKVLATDPATDIAIIQLQGAKNLPTVSLGDSDSLEIGQTVIAIGNVLGQYRNTVTKGVVSGLSRTISAGGGSGSSETLEDVVQTDAAINPGNSGGPLLNLAGQAIGINTAVDQEGQLIGFAIPINQVRRDVTSVKNNGKISRPFLGVRYRLITEDYAKQNKLPVDYGALVIRGETPDEIAVVPGSAADKAGIVENNIILEFDGQKVTPDSSLAKFIQGKQVGDTVKLKILHKGQEKTVTATLGSL